MRLNYLILVCLIVYLVLSSSVLAEVENEWQVKNLDGEKLLNIGSSIVSFVLAGLTIAGFSRTRNRRLLYVSAAFILFGIKTFLFGAEIFFGEWVWVDPVTSLMDFAILLSFFMGIIRK